ncbi:6844_t:CDS:1, partial [Gigaspora rosea]
VWNGVNTVYEVVSEGRNVGSNNNVDRACEVVGKDWNVECDNSDRVCEVVGRG